MSTALGLTTIGKALGSAEDFISCGQLDWQPVNENQARFLQELPGIRKAFPLISTLQGWARRTAAELNAILESVGSPVRLQPWRDDGKTFGVVALNDVTVQWNVVGQTEEEWNPGKKFLINGKPSFRLKSSTAGVKLLSSSKHQHPIVSVPTKTGDTVYLTKHCPLSGFALLERIRELSDGLVPGVKNRYEGVEIPMVKLGLKVDISWLLGLWTVAGLDPWTIVQAVQGIRFGMNQYGARVREETALAVMRGLPQYYKVDESFLMWIERPGVSVPLFMAHITEDSWQDPGDLAKL